MKDEWRKAVSDDQGRGNTNPRAGALEQQPENQPEEGRKQHGEVVGHRMTHRMLMSGHPLLYGRRVLMVLVHGNRKSGAKVQSPEDPVAQEERAHEKERQKRALGSAEAGARHRAHSTKVVAITDEELPTNVFGVQSISLADL